jgi:MerR family redox-sensitive transcriptional activator SoxR
MTPQSIGEASLRTGVPASTLRYYERAGLLPRVARSSGRRLYDERDIQIIEVLRFAQQAGFSLNEIKRLFHGFDEAAPLGLRWQRLAQEKLRELEELESTVKRMRLLIERGLACGCMRFEDCLLTGAIARERP